MFENTAIHNNTPVKPVERVLRATDPSYQAAQMTAKKKPQGSAFVGILAIIMSLTVMLGTAYATFIGGRAMYRYLDDKGAFDNTFWEYVDFDL